MEKNSALTWNSSFVYSTMRTGESEYPWWRISTPTSLKWGKMYRPGIPKIADWIPDKKSPLSCHAKWFSCKLNNLRIKNERGGDLPQMFWWPKLYLMVISSSWSCSGSFLTYNKPASNYRVHPWAKKCASAFGPKSGWWWCLGKKRKWISP